MKPDIVDVDMMDARLDKGDVIQVEAQHAAAEPGMLKLYVHVNGKTILRVSGIRPEAIDTIWPSVARKSNT